MPNKTAKTAAKATGSKATASKVAPKSVPNAVSNKPVSSKPVVASNQATFWRCLELIGCTEPIAGFGALLSRK